MNLGTTIENCFFDFVPWTIHPFSKNVNIILVYRELGEDGERHSHFHPLVCVPPVVPLSYA